MAEEIKQLKYKIYSVDPKSKFEDLSSKDSSKNELQNLSYEDMPSNSSA